MNTKLLPAVILALSITGFATAQTKDKTSSKQKDESFTIRKKGDSKEKVTIVIDGDNITVNGKPLEDLKDSDIEVLRRDGISSIPKLRKLAPMGGMKMFGDEFFPAGNRAFLGVESEKSDKGVTITSVEKESAAEKSGLKKNDVITKVGDDKIESSDDLYETIGKYKPEEKVAVTYLRDGKPATVTATLGKSKTANVRIKLNGEDFNNGFNRDFDIEMPKMRAGKDGMNFSFNRKPRLGLEIQDVEDGKGVKILDVDSDTPAAKAGLQKDDVISEIDGKSIASVDELRTKLSGLKEGDSIKVTYQRAGKSQSTDIKFPKKLKTADL